MSEKKLNNFNAQSASVDVLRRRLSQAEMQLREMEEEAKRFSEQHNREIELLRNENTNYKEKLEEVRMSECMTENEYQRMRKTQGQSKLLASSTAKYNAERDEIQRKRAECTEQEAKLVTIRQELNEARAEKRRMRRLTVDAKLSAHSRLYSALQMNDGTRGQLKGLEYHVDKELTRFSEFAAATRKVREEIDALLITQSRYERNYRKRENELMEKKKEMAFLIEVCNLLFQEREQRSHELVALHELEKSEFDAYENAFNELTSVLEQDAQLKEEHEKRIATLIQEIKETKSTRVRIEQDNEAKQISQRLRLHQSTSEYSEKNDSAYVSENENGNESVSEKNRYEEVLAVLGEIVESDEVEAIVNFPKQVAEARFQCFDELNRLNESLCEMERERKVLQGELTRELSAEKRKRYTRMAELRKNLRELQRQTLEEDVLCNKDDRVWQHILMDIEKMFEGLSCSKEALRSQCGMESVLRTSSSAALQLVDQRVEEYLMAYSRKTQIENVSQGQHKIIASVNAAKAILRRPDLPPKDNVTLTTKQLVQNSVLPYSADDANEGSEDIAPLSQEEMKEMVRKGRVPNY